MVLVFKDTVLTNKGFDVSNRAALGQTPFSIFKAVSTDTDLTNYKIEDLKNLTSLPNEIDSGTILDYDSPQNSISVINLDFNNSQFKQGYTIRAIGLYGKTANGDVFLHSLTVSDTSVVVPEISGNIFDGVKHSISIFSGNNKNMNVNIQQTSNATVKYVNDSISNISDTIKNDIQPKLDAKADKIYLDEKVDDISEENQKGFEGLGNLIQPLLNIDEIKKDIDNRFKGYQDDLDKKQNDVSLISQNNKLYYNGTPVLIANAPNQPKLDVNIDRDTGNLTYQITPPSVDGGASISNYLISYRLITDDNWQTKQIDGNTLYGQIAGLQRGQTYQFKVIATNYAGKSIESETKQILTAIAPRGVKINITNAVGAFSYEISVEDDGGAKQ
ncbi:fibronectin type III domain-containing protein [Apilactobacillus micheneri]|uniref:fibronectin type III domain-containing protein n=1 Tax=Apilactobacillus micheneri TaxID=1899430 RepID=UPI001126F865|nr:fibronectin type III domain-containing protein [Apilactobacillus micheneri]TPR41281.1 fibronectin type III domain-containing protein [Apilactobacillus micheneri]